MVTNKKELVCSYKEHRYILLYNGKTRTGENGALIQYFNRKRKFWVDSKDISNIEEKREGEGEAEPKIISFPANIKTENKPNMYISNNEVDLMLTALANLEKVNKSELRAGFKSTAIGNVKRIEVKTNLTKIAKLREKLAKL
jgi:hypothetical protein